MGETHVGAGTMDWMEQEQERVLQITSGCDDGHLERTETGTEPDSEKHRHEHHRPRPGHVDFHNRSRDRSLGGLDAVAVTSWR